MFHVFIYHSVDLNHYQTQTQTQSLKLSFTDFDSGHKELFVFYHWKLLKGSRFWYRPCRVLVGSLRSKRFRLVSGQKKTVEDFRFWPREQKKWEPKNERGGRGRGRKDSFFFLPHALPALLLAPFFARSLTLVPRSLLLNRTETLATHATYWGAPGAGWGGTPDNGKLKSCTWI